MLLNIDHISKRFNAITAIRELSFSISEGEVLGITGPKGSGKTTLTNLIMGVHPINEGDILFADQRINGCSTEEIIPMGIARTFEVPQPFREMTLPENIMLGGLYGRGHLSIKAARDAAMDILDRVGIGEKAETKASELDLFDLKKLELARALSLKPRLLLIDEISTGLAAEEKNKIWGLLRSLKEDGLSILILEHVPGLADDLFDRVMVLNFGELVAEGVPGEIIQNPRVREIYLGKEEAPEVIETPVEDKTHDTESAGILSVQDISTGHGNLKALSGVSLDVFKGDIVALIGVNGSGRTTLINAVNRTIPVLNGDILFKGMSIINKKPYEMAELGITQCTEGRQIFLGLTVRENLELGAYCKRARAKWRSTMERVFDLFPVLAGRRDQIAGALSVGEQQMTAIGCALMGLPEFIIFDELSLGMAPIIIEKLHEAIVEINRQGITILLADQNIGQSLEIADRGYIIEKGRIIRSGNSRELRQDEYLNKVCFGE